jgi:hypothetical protein
MKQESLRPDSERGLTNVTEFYLVLKVENNAAS